MKQLLKVVGKITHLVIIVALTSFVGSVVLGIVLGAVGLVLILDGGDATSVNNICLGTLGILNLLNIVAAIFYPKKFFGFWTSLRNGAIGKSRKFAHRFLEHTWRPDTQMEFVYTNIIAPSLIGACMLAFIMRMEQNAPTWIVTMSYLLSIGTIMFTVWLLHQEEKVSQSP